MKSKITVYIVLFYGFMHIFPFLHVKLSIYHAMFLIMRKLDIWDVSIQNNICKKQEG